jgi:acyl-CoA synthetase (AMP-forming)/AMP-acid ligase II
MRILEHLADHASTRPDALAARAFGPCAERPLTYSVLWERVRSVARFISARAPEGGVVLLSCANRPEFIIAYLGVLGAGRTIFPVHPRLAPAELRSAATAAEASLLIGEGGAPASLPAVPYIDIRALAEVPSATSGGAGAGRPGLMLQSSGTTALPKVVYRDGPALDEVAANVARAAELTRDDRVLGAVPVGHSYGMENVLLAPIWAGACALLCDGFDVPVVTSLLNGERGATVLPGTPFMFEMLGALDGAPARPSGLRLAYSAGSPLQPGASAAFADRFGPAVGQLYGATEVGSVTFNDPRGLHTGSAFDPASVGLPMEGVRLATREVHEGEAEILVRAPSMLSRYVGEPSSPFTASGGELFFPTGDLGRIDPAGRLWVTGRLKLLIDVGGMKVNPLEVEHVLAQHPAVGRCAVVGVRLSPTVSRVKAILTPRGAGGTVDPESVRGFARERLSAHKVPRVFEVRETLPLSPGGKVQRWRLAAESEV